MDAIYIPHLAKLFDQSETIQVDDYLPGLETLTPVQGRIRVTHRGTYLEVKAKAEAIVTLTCDRCLQKYNHRLIAKPEELIWLEEEPEDPNAYPLEREISLEELVETLPLDGYFEPGKWLYEQLCLEIPHRQLCNKNCEGIQPPEQELQEPSPTYDGRWASLEALKHQMNS